VDPLRVWILGASLTCGLAVLALAALVLVATPRRLPHLLMVAYLLAACVNVGSEVVVALGTSPFVVYNAEFDSFVGVALICAAYPLFVAANLDTPLTRPLRTPAGRVAWLVLCGALVAALYARPALVVARLVPDAEGVPFPEDGPWGSGLGLLVGTLTLCTLACALAALRRAPAGSAARRRATWYAVAFGAQDAAAALGLILPVALGLPPRTGYAAASVMVPLGVTAGVALVATAMVREHLFDADLRLKAGLRRGAVAAAFLAAFFVVAQLIQNVASQALGYLAGAVVAGLMLFALRPIERAASRLADAAMPQVRDTEEYRTVRKREVYRAAVESAMSQGSIPEAQRGVLATLADHLGLGAREALEIERAATATA
jgi:hypothetical protein